MKRNAAEDELEVAHWLSN